MRFFSAAEIDAAFDFPDLIDALARAFRGGIEAPLRHRHAIADNEANSLLLMPAWTTGNGARFVGAKILTVYPENAKRGLASTTATYFLMSGDTGFPLAGFDGHELTVWRTAAASALASRYLSRVDASRLLIVGAGSLAPYLARAHAGARPIAEIAIWNRTASRAEKLAAELRAGGFNAQAVTRLEAAARAADIISCATLSTEPLIKGDWLKDGAHLDLVGGFTPAMREADDRAAARARVYVDTRAALKEAGDIAVPLQHGALREADIRGDLFELCLNKVKGRGSASEITLFKSVGSAIEDLAAAILLWEKCGAA
jgi:ornithine cyclodeaminase/alanine dehydrogenase-like protein (mu-crystallin family)